MSILVTRSGDIAVDTVTDLIQLYGFIATDGNVSHLRLPFTTSGYQVTAGKTLYLVRMMVLGSGANGWWKLGYADNDVGYNTATARTNPIMAIGTDDTNNNGMLRPAESFATVGLPQNLQTMIWKLAIATKYPFVRRVGATPNDTVMLWCVEL
ncbi:MAG: hypothetical protein KGL39_18735 [Patescibacteria group bacterium]|nr:hypothetical protein [Patescibacteria group bacterium]